MINIMKIKIAILLASAFLAACTGGVLRTGGDKSAETTADGTSTAATLNGYKQDIAQRISQVNSTKTYTGRPQALLRSVIVLKFSIDGKGNLIRSEIQRSNHDRTNEATALASLRNTAPFPKPSSHLVRHGRVEISESWLFNNDGRFQLRSIALPQMDE